MEAPCSPGGTSYGIIPFPKRSLVLPPHPNPSWGPSPLALAPHPQPRLRRRCRGCRAQHRASGSAPRARSRAIFMMQQAGMEHSHEQGR